MAQIGVLGTFDSKGEELAFIADCIRQHGHTPVRIDVGTYGPPQVPVDVTRETVAKAAGIDLAPILTRQDRGECVSTMARTAAAYLAQTVAYGTIHGVISIGGGGGSSIASTAMRALPVGFPKLLVSTLAGSRTGLPDIGVKDVVMMPSIVDVAGLNRISRLLFAQAAAAVSAMVSVKVDASQDKPLIAASMFGNTTRCINEARKVLEDAGYEVLVFHATGQGGKTMEALIASGMFVGVLDITTTEWADEVVGGILGAGPTRLEAAAQAGIPTVVSTGCLDMVNFGSMASVPDHFKDRLLYKHNDQVTLMRTSKAEYECIAEVLAEKLNAYPNNLVVCLPEKGLSEIGMTGKAFHDNVADHALHAALRTHLRADVPCDLLAADVNDSAFAQHCAHRLLAMIDGE